MKDKLVKHHLPKSYFLRRKIMIISLILLGLAASVAIPVGVSIYYQNHISQVQK